MAVKLQFQRISMTGGLKYLTLLTIVICCGLAAGCSDTGAADPTPQERTEGADIVIHGQVGEK